MKTKAWVVFAVLALFVTGSANTILTKVLLTTKAVGEDGKAHLFQKPFFGTANMFFAMCLVMPVYWCKGMASKRQGAKMNPDLGDTLLPDQQPDKTGPSMAKQLLFVAPPSFFDLLSMGLMLIGMLYIPASVWQMLRGANIIFAAILTVLILRRRLYAFHWLGVALALLGVGLVSVAALNSEHDTSQPGNKHAAFGVSIVLVAQAVQAAQIILEEQLLNDLAMDPMLIVGVEGIWGLLFVAIIMPVLYLLPGHDHGHAEDSRDTALMIKNNSLVQQVILMYMVSVATYNVSGMQVTSALSGVMRVMLEATRTLCVWLFTLAWHYLIDQSSPFGETWTNWSYLQALGFGVLIVGQGTYGQRIIWPGLYYPPPDPPAEAHFASPSAIRAGAFASPSPGVERPGNFASPGAAIGGRGMEEPESPKSSLSLQGLES